MSSYRLLLNKTPLLGAKRMDQHIRTKMLVGESAMNKMKNSHVAVFGLGGVGSWVVEALARAGIGQLTLVDNDSVSITNINRQLPALHSTVGRQKTDVLRERVLDINPDCVVHCRDEFFSAQTCSGWFFSGYDYIIDAIDTVKSKLLLIELTNAVGTPIISCMGMGNRLDPTKITVSDISKTSYDGLARVIRKELKKRGISKLKCVWSTEEALEPEECDEPLPEGCSRRSLPGSISFVPSAAGLVIAGEVIRDICGISAKA